MHGECEGGGPEDLHHHPGRYALRLEKAGSSVAAVVPAMVWDSGLLLQLSELVGDNRSGERLSERRSEDKPPVLPLHTSEEALFDLLLAMGFTALAQTAGRGTVRRLVRDFGSLKTRRPSTRSTTRLTLTALTS
jgi:hypothetical protein